MLDQPRLVLCASLRTFCSAEPPVRPDWVDIDFAYHGAASPTNILGLDRALDASFAVSRGERGGPRVRRRLGELRTFAVQSFKRFRPSMNRTLQSLPTFLGIGSMRCGSTWLYEVLKQHPDIQVSEMKEVDFFFMKRMMRHDLNWYEDLFRSPDGSQVRPVRGEISPGYARLKEWQVRQIAKLLPNLRILLTLRHPIDRLWSQTVYTFGHLRGRDIRSVGSLELVRQLERARSKLSSDYIRIVKIWTALFGRERLHIGLFDDLRLKPKTFVNDILTHIGASVPWSLPEELLENRVWSTSSLVSYERAIPEVVQWYMADQLLDSTKQLNDLLDGRLSVWVEELRSLSGGTRPSWRILREVNRKLLSVPENVAYKAYHAGLDAKMWLRWHQLRTSYIASNVTRGAPVSSTSGICS